MSGGSLKEMDKAGTEEQKEDILDIYTEDGFDLEEVIWQHAKLVHHTAYHLEDNSEDTSAKEEDKQKELTDPQEEDIKKELTDPKEEDTQKELTDPKEEDKQKELTEPQEEDTQKELTDPKEEDTQKEMTDPKEEDTQELTDPKEEDTQKTPAEPKEKDKQKELTEPKEEETEDINKCEKCNKLARLYSLDTSSLKIKHAKPRYSLKPWKPKNPTTLQLLESEYENNMDTIQKFSFKAERRTTSVASVELKNPVLFGSAGYKIAIRLPEEVRTQCSAFGEKLHPTKGKEEFKEEIQWSVDNLIECPPRKTTKAYLMLKEHRYASEFMIDTVMKGTVTVTIHEQDRNRPQQVTLDIAEVLQRYNDEETSASRQGKGKKPEVEFKVDDQGKVCYTTEGRCKFVFGVELYTRTETEEEPGKPSNDISSSCCVII